MTASINGTSGITYPDGSVQGTAATAGMVNKIINGRMEIDQRNAGASVTSSSTAPYTLDRWQSYSTVSSKYTIQQNAGSVTPPAGFTNYLGITSSSAYTVGASERFAISQSIEGFNTADLGFGTANAKTVTLSFWVRSSLTGTFGGALRNSAGDRSYPFTYSISVANTWEQKSVTIAGDTTGTWIGATNGIGLSVFFGLGVGSTLSGTAGAWASANYNSATGATSVVGTNGATFYITGVDLRKGSVAPTTYNMDWRPYGLELALCQRYYYKVLATSTSSMFGYGYTDTTTSAKINTTFPIQMRTAPSALEQSGTATDYRINYSGGISTNCSSVPTFESADVWAATSAFTVASGLTAGQGCRGRSNTGATGYLGWSAEL